MARERDQHNLPTATQVVRDWWLFDSSYPGWPLTGQHVLHISFMSRTARQPLGSLAIGSGEVADRESLWSDGRLTAPLGI